MYFSHLKFVSRYQAFVISLISPEMFTLIAQPPDVQVDRCSKSVHVTMFDCGSLKLGSQLSSPVVFGDADIMNLTGDLRSMSQPSLSR